MNPTVTGDEPMIDPLHETSGPDTYWTTVNTAEAMPGVMTPLGWTFWGGAIELAMRGAMVDLGVLEKDRLAWPDSPDDRFTAIFHGRVAANVDLMRDVVGNRLPGTSAAALELQLLGGVRPDVVNRPTRRRYGAVANRLPTSAALLPRRLRAARAATDTWWRRSVLGDPPSSPSALLVEAFDHFAKVMRLHCLASFLCQGMYEQVTRLAQRADMAGAEVSLIGGYGGLEETALAADLWAVAQGRLELEEFISRHGYHGPNEGEISARAWRDDPGPLHISIARYRTMAEDRHPHRLEAARTQLRHRTEQELLGRLPALLRPGARLILDAARRYMPLREVGKAAFLQSIDVGRFAARTLGHELAATTQLTDAEDVFSLTLEELRTPTRNSLTDVVAERQRRRREHLTVSLPDSWTGQPAPIGQKTADTTGEVRGIAASAGMHEGTARIVTDPAIADIEDGDVVVCEATDPSWTLLFVTAGALVIDIGGPISHGAIIAREMGIPCVINTRTGTRAIKDGDLVRVDGGNGTVEILAAAGQELPA